MLSTLNKQGAKGIMARPLRRRNQQQKLNKRRSMPKQSKCTPVRRKIICKAIKAGLGQRRACQLAGVSHTQFKSWVNKGKDNFNQAYRMFSNRIARLNAVNEKEALDIIQSAMKGGEKIRETKIHITDKGMEITKIVKTRGSNWQAAAWRLERMDPETYGRKFIEYKEDEKEPEQVASEIRAALLAMDDSVPQQEVVNA